jgi:hypothetical protein
MTHSVQQRDVEVSRLHNLAIRKEIGERLAIGMKPKPSAMPSHLMMLARQLCDETSNRLLSPLP